MVILEYVVFSINPVLGLVSVVVRAFLAPCSLPLHRRNRHNANWSDGQIDTAHLCAFGTVKHHYKPDGCKRDVKYRFQLC